MSAPAGRHSLSHAMAETRNHRRGVLRARLDETGTDPVWLDSGRDAEVYRLARLDRMWQRTGPGRRDRWATALARDLGKRAFIEGMSLGVDGVEVHLGSTSAAEVVARQSAPKLTPMPESMRKLLTPGPVDPARAVAEAEKVLGGRS